MSYFSIIVPCYNSSEKMSKLFASLENQVYKDFDVIFIDDCSSDCTTETLEKYVTSATIKAKIIRNTENLGPSLSRQKGVLESNSNYVCFCDADDALNDHFLKEIYLQIKKSDCDIVFFNHTKVFSKKRKKTINSVKCVKELSKSELIVSSTDSMCCLSIKRSVISSIVFPNLRNGEDMALIPVLIQNSSSFGFIEKDLYYYYCGSNTLSTAFSNHILDNLRESFAFILNNIGDEYSSEKEFLGIRNYLYASVLMASKYNLPKYEVDKVFAFFESIFDNWKKNKYLHTLPLFKKIILFSAKKHLYWIARLLSKLHTILTNG